MQLFTSSIRRIGLLSTASLCASVIEPRQSLESDSFDSLLNASEVHPNTESIEDSKPKHTLQTASNKYEYDIKLLSDMADDFTIFHGTNCIDLTEEVATILQKEVSELKISRFADGEINCRLGIVSLCARIANDN